MRLARVITAMALAALGLASAGCAAHHGGWGYHERGQDAYRIGYDRGYDDGCRYGRADGRRHDGYGYAREREYRHADRGYRSSYGSRRLYADGYRRGYEEGYRRTFEEAREHRHGGGRPR